MSEFIRVEIDREKCVGTKDCGRCVAVCPVSIFGDNGGKPVIRDDNEDECTLCELCQEECEPGAIIIMKLYENGP